MSDAIKFWLARELVGIGLLLLALICIGVVSVFVTKAEERKK